MAYDIGPKIGIEGEADFRQAIRNINTNIRTLGTEMLAVTSAYDANDKSAASLTARNEVLVKQIDAQKEKLAKLKEGLAASAEKYGENDSTTQKWQQTINVATAELNKMERQLEGNTQELEDLAGRGDEAAKSTREVGSSMEETKGAAKGLQSALSSVGSGLATMAKAAAAAVGAATAAVTAFAKSSIDTGMQFDSAMSQVAATMGTTVDQIGELRDFAMEMGASTAFSANEAAQALNYMALAGYDAGTAMEMLPTVLDLAAAGGIDLASASDMVTDAQSALGLSIEETAEMVDKMAQASSKSNTSVEQLGEAILTIGGTAQNLAGGTTELSTALGILADNGIKGAEGGTHLRNVILSLSSPTDKAAAALTNLGVEVFDAAGNMRPLNETLGDLDAAMSTMTQAEKTDLISTIFNKTDISAVNALLANTGDRWNELTGYIDNAAGAAGNMASTQLDNLAGDITLFKSALEGAQIVLSDQLTPYLREFVQFGSEGIASIANAFKEDGLSGAMDAFGTVLSDGLNMIIEQLPAMVDAGMQLLGALGQGLLDNLPIITDAALQVIMMLADGLLSSLPELASAAVEIVSTLANGLSEALPELIPTVTDVILQIVETLTDPDNLSNIFDSAIELISSLADGIVDALPGLIEKAPVIIQNLVTAIVENVPKLLEAAVEIIAKLAAGLITNLPEMHKAAAQIITTLVSGIFELRHNILDVGKGIVSGVWEGIQGMGSWIKEKVSGFFGGIVDSVKGLLGIHSPSKVFAGIGGYMAEGLGEGFSDEMGAVQRNIERSMAELAGNASGTVKVSGRVSGPQSVDAGRLLAELPALMAEAVRREFEGMAVNLNQRKVGEMTSAWIANNARAMGM